MIKIYILEVKFNGEVKKISAAFIAFLMIISMVGCGDMHGCKIDGYEIRAGIYIYYSYSAYMTALDKLQDKGIDTENKGS